jgi:hypothetical protein
MGGIIMKRIGLLPLVAALGAWLACCRIPAGSENMNVFGLRDNLIRDYEQV